MKEETKMSSLVSVVIPKRNVKQVSTASREARELNRQVIEGVFL